LRIYADSSFIVSLYVRELNTIAALREIRSINTRGDSIYLSQLARLETTNALHLAVFRHRVTRADLTESLKVLESNIEAGAFRIVQSPNSIWKDAEQLSEKHVPTFGYRSLDVLHVANALLLNAELFLTFDQRQRALALAAGLNAPDLNA